MQKIIAFYSPYPRAGKTTAAVLLLQKYGFKLLSFANPISVFVSRVIEKTEAYDWRKAFHNKNEPITGLDGASWRDFMIAFGQAGRSVYQNVWADIVKTEIIKNPSQNFVIDDLRFQNEYEMLKEQGAKLVRVANPDRKIVKSETEGLLEDYRFDYYLPNDHTSLFAYQSYINIMMKILWPEEYE